MMTALVPNCLKSILVSLLVATVATPSSAQSPCDADLDHDGIVAGADLAIVLGDWGACKGCQGDLTNNGVVDGIDLAFVLTLWGGECIVPWATVLEQSPDSAVVFDAGLRARIVATGLPWRVRDNGTGIEMVLVPPGTFDMGCSPSIQYGCRPDESPVRTVVLTNAFYIGRYEVTQAQWTARMGTNPSFFSGQPDSPTRPVENVSWITLQGFLAAGGLRLPTEAEWEYACRAGSATAFHASTSDPTGTSDDARVGVIAWFSGNSGNQTKPAGQRAPNSLGLYDMSGNVWEWVNDWYSPDAYASGAFTNPQGPPSGTDRLLRGGAFAGLGTFLRSSARYPYPPEGVGAAVGFRVARNP